jgi:acetyl esterase
MTFDPDVERFLAIMRQSAGPPMSELPEEEARSGYRRMCAALGGRAVDMATVASAAAVGPAGPIPLRLYRPHGLAEGPAPALVFFHGGGWVIGDLDSHDKLCRQIAHRSTCLVVAVDYRLAPEHPTPAAAEDAIAAYAWLAAHAATLGIDPDRLAVGGDSAGGSLSAVVALAARDLGLAPRCQILIYPSTDNRPGGSAYPSRSAFAGIPPLTHDTMQYFRARFLPDPRVAEDWRVSPMLAPDMSRVAPALILTAGCDLLHDEGVRYGQRLEQAGVELMHRNFPGMIHGFIAMGALIEAANEALDTIALMLRQRLLPTSHRWQN